MAEQHKLTVSYEQDIDATSPRDYDCLGTMACFHKRYSLGDKTTINHSDFNSWDDLMKKGLMISDATHIWLPLYLYDHSGITMSTTPFGCPWDSGQVGFIYISKEDVRREYACKRITKQVRQKVIEALNAEVESYSDYIEGNVFCAKIEHFKDDKLNTSEYVGGLIGTESVIDFVSEYAQSVGLDLTKISEEIKSGISSSNHFEVCLT